MTSAHTSGAGVFVLVGTAVGVAHGGEAPPGLGTPAGRQGTGVGVAHGGDIDGGLTGSHGGGETGSHGGDCGGLAPGSQGGGGVAGQDRSIPPSGPMPPASEHGGDIGHHDPGESNLQKTRMVVYRLPVETETSAARSGRYRESRYTSVATTPFDVTSTVDEKLFGAIGHSMVTCVPSGT